MAGANFGCYHQLPTTAQDGGKYTIPPFSIPSWCHSVYGGGGSIVVQRRRVVRGEYLFIWTESGLPLTGRAPPYEGKKLMMSAQGGQRDNFVMGIIS